ncbi:MAG: hypothetical protein KF883_04230 [Thermomicrobiales bacterium]|nr:hypothetical protein [Thermomicrobiales bacterium]
MIPIDLANLARTTEVRGPVWSDISDDLNVNLLVFDEGQGVDEHVNQDVDVLLTVVHGQGHVTIDGDLQTLAAGSVVIVAKGSARSITAASDRFAYLTCHRRRAGLMPRVKPAQNA